MRLTGVAVVKALVPLGTVVARMVKTLGAPPH